METPFLIAGLGNPGRKYAGTRHNAGFLALERLARTWGAAWEPSRRFRAEVAKALRGSRVVWLCRPQTFMNLSGESVGPISRYYQVPVDRLMVVVDDADLPLGTVRMRGEGGPGGHHGLESVQQCLGDRGYGRQRIGIGRTGAAAERRELSDHVLGRFEPGELDLLERAMVRATDQLECWLAEGLSSAMNRFNGTELNAET